MEKNMDNGDLIVDDLVQELAVSRSVFFKKLKTLTGSIKSYNSAAIGTINLQP